MDVLITSEPGKLPAEIRQLQDESRPLPAGVQFFEEQFRFGGLVTSLIFGVLLAAAGIIVILLFFVILFTPSRGATVYSSSTLTYDFMLGGFGLALLIGGYLMLKSIGAKRQLRRQQQSGKPTRYGIFLVGDLLVSHNWFDTTVLPRAFFRELKGSVVHYEVNGAAKIFRLPDEIVGQSRSALETAIQSWAGPSSRGL